MSSTEGSMGEGTEKVALRVESPKLEADDG